MKIIKQGRLPQETRYKGKCSVCGTIYECLENEGKKIPDFRNGYMLRVKCPVCGFSDTSAYPRNDDDLVPRYLD